MDFVLKLIVSNVVIIICVHQKLLGTREGKVPVTR